MRVPGPLRSRWGGLRGLPGLACGLVLLASCPAGETTPPPPPPGAIAAGQSIGTGSITGRVRLDAPPPPRQTIKISDSGCGHDPQTEPLSETVVANPDGTLRNVVVSVKSGLGDRVFAPPGPAILDQKGCIYSPHVISVQTNQIVTFVNSDPTLHNVHAVAKVNPPFNFGMAVKGQKVSRFFSKPEVVKMKCDVHSWMSSYVAIFPHPFHAVSGSDGTFELKGLPAGDYEIEAWHETYGTRTQSITLSEGESRSVEFHFGG